MSKDKKYISKITNLDQMGGYWSKYKDNSIGRAINYIYHICGLDAAEQTIFHSDGKVTLYGNPFATIDWSNGYPHFNFIEDRYNQKQKDLLKLD